MVVHALCRARELLPFPLRGVDVYEDSLFMNDLVVGWCRTEWLEATRSLAHRKNDQAWVEQKNGAIAPARYVRVKQIVWPSMLDPVRGPTMARKVLLGPLAPPAAVAPAITVADEGALATGRATPSRGPPKPSATTRRTPSTPPSSG